MGIQDLFNFWVLQPRQATEAEQRAGPSREQKDPQVAAVRGPSPTTAGAGPARGAGRRQQPGSGGSL